MPKKKKRERERDRKLQANITDEHRCKNPQQNSSYRIQQHIKKIIRDYYEQLYTNKMDNLDEMQKFFEKYNLPKLNEEEI